MVNLLIRMVAIIVLIQYEILEKLVTFIQTSEYPPPPTPLSCSIFFINILLDLFIYLITHYMAVVTYLWCLGMMKVLCMPHTILVWEGIPISYIPV